MPRDSNRKTGNTGEKLALEYLIARGFILVETNWRHSRTEIDLIMMDEGTIVFIEVKARSSDYFGHPEKAVNKAKQHNIVTAAEAYLYEKNPDKEIRFDVVSVLLNKAKPEIYHIRDAFIPHT